MLKSVLTSNILFATITTNMVDQLHFPLNRLNAFLNILKHDTIPTKSFADAFETVIGKLYRDKGFSVVQTWVSAVFKPIIKAAIDGYHHLCADRLCPFLLLFTRHLVVTSALLFTQKNRVPLPGNGSGVQMISTTSTNG